MPSPEPRSTDEMLTLVSRQAAHRIGRRVRRRRVLKVSSVLIVALAIMGGAVVVGAGRGSVSRFNTVGAKIDRVQLTSGAGSSATGSDALRMAPSDRQVVSTGSITVRVDDVEATAPKAAAIATDAGGYVTKSTTKLEGDQAISLTLRVPADDFDEAMDQAAALGDVQARTTDARDVTDQVVDLKGRLKTAQLSADRLRELLVGAENVQNIITINDRLAALENEIEQLTGELKVVEDQVAFATITVRLTEREASPSVNDDLPGPLQALRSGAVAFVNVALVALAAVAFALPFLLVAVGAWWGVRRWRGRHLRS